MKTTIIALLLAALAVPSVALAHGSHGPSHRDDRSHQYRDDRRDDGFDRGDPRHAEVVVRRGHDDDVESQIRWGVQRGLLTRYEADRLRAQNRDVEALKRRVYRDGRLSRGEAKQLARATDRLHAALRTELRDNDVRGVRTASYVPAPHR